MRIKRQSHGVQGRKIYNGKKIYENVKVEDEILFQ